jgi:hypothetical protein
LGLFDKVLEQRGARRKRRMIDVAVQRYVHSENELSHNRPFVRWRVPRLRVLCFCELRNPASGDPLNDKPALVMVQHR